uniref:C2H2-type domain-containing protein n=1 Tax=Callorhinchus milii TaxID=7868 RepID=A0A4W3JTX2_CALMI|eukprot:gi/632966006/ref/XP_007899179.1/ PREDICTED: zinc finger protein 414 [Callorhinchus milii]
MSQCTASENRVVATTQSMEGKVFKCSTNDCTEAFASMQHLMNHMRAHYKPNRYFKCETCKLSFRSHRSLFKHLHVCPNLATNALSLKAEKPWSPGRPASSEPDPLLKTPVPVEPVIFQSVIKQLEKEGSADTVSPAASSKPASALPSPLPSLHTSLGSMPLVSTGPHPFSLLQPSLFAAPGLGRFPGQAHAQVPGPFIPYMHPGPYSLPQAGLQPRLRPYVPSQSLPFSNAVWRKSAAQSANSRIVWEHTRGRYNCMQCPYSGMSREEITSHVQEHGKGLPSRLPNEVGVFVNSGDNYSPLSMQFGESLFT